jgi:hypothetical protein
MQRWDANSAEVARLSHHGRNEEIHLQYDALPMPGSWPWHMTRLQHPLDTGVDEKAALPNDLANITVVNRRRTVRTR